MNSVVDVIVELGNPFDEINKDLYTLDTRQIMPEKVVNTIKSAEDVGKAQYNQFVADCINDNIKEFNDSIR